MKRSKLEKCEKSRIAKYSSSMLSMICQIQQIGKFPPRDLKMNGENSWQWHLMRGKPRGPAWLRQRGREGGNIFFFTVRFFLVLTPFWRKIDLYTPPLPIRLFGFSLLVKISIIEPICFWPRQGASWYISTFQQLPPSKWSHKSEHIGITHTDQCTVFHLRNLFLCSHFFKYNHLRQNIWGQSFIMSMFLHRQKIELKIYPKNA